MQETIRQLARRLDGYPPRPELQAVYLELAPLLGQLQGAVGRARRTHGETPEVRRLETSLEAVKAGLRQVGFDIRLARDVALLVGLQSVLQGAQEVADQLENLER